MRIEGIEPGIFEGLSGPAEDEQARRAAQFVQAKNQGSDTLDLDKLILADYFASDPNAERDWAAASADERAEFLEQKRMDPYYAMTADQYKNYVKGQREMSASENTVGMSPEAAKAYLSRLEKKVPLWVWLAGGGAVAYFVFRRGGS